MDRFERIAVDHEVTEAADVVLGLCPGCELWQLDYTYSAMYQYIRMLPGNQLAMHPDVSVWHVVIEDALAEHLMECTHLQRLLVD